MKSTPTTFPETVSNEAANRALKLFVKRSTTLALSFLLGITHFPQNAQARPDYQSKITDTHEQHVQLITVIFKTSDGVKRLAISKNQQLYWRSPYTNKILLLKFQGVLRGVSVNNSIRYDGRFTILGECKVGMRYGRIEYKEKPKSVLLVNILTHSSRTAKGFSAEFQTNLTCRINNKKNNS